MAMILLSIYLHCASTILGSKVKRSVVDNYTTYLSIARLIIYGDMYITIRR